MSITAVNHTFNLDSWSISRSGRGISFQELIKYVLVCLETNCCIFYTYCYLLRLTRYMMYITEEMESIKAFYKEHPEVEPRGNPLYILKR